MDEILRQALTILRGMWQWRWTGLIVTWLVAAVAAVVIVRMPDQYEASARVFIDTESMLKPLMSGLAIQPNVDQQITMVSRTLISRPNVEKLVRMADLDHTAQSKEEREKLVDGLMRSLGVASAGQQNLYVLTYRDTKPATAQRVVQSLTSIFVESSLKNKRRDTDSAKQFIEDQIKVYEKKLFEAENRLKQFKLRNINLNMGGQGPDSFARVGELNNALSQARLELREAENSRDALKRQISGEEPVLLGGPLQEASGVTISTPELDSRIDAMKRNLDSLLQRYTDSHPDVSGAKRVIKELEDQQRQELAARKAAMGPRPKAAPTNVLNNPVYQQLKVSLAEAEANVASLQTRVAEYESRYARAKASLQMVPEIEAEYTQLNRDYAVHKSNYDALVTRRESAEISGQMEATAAVADFRLIDPPRVGSEPVAPNRPRLFLLAFLGALAAGVFATFAASQIRPSFLDARSLRDATGLPVLGTVSFMTSPEARRKERRGFFGFIAATIALLGSYGIGVFVMMMLSTRTV